MTKIAWTLVTICFITGSVMAYKVTFIKNPNPSIVILEGYEHGVAFCGAEKTFRLGGTSILAKYQNREVTAVINSGHRKDPEVDKLINLAFQECKKLK
jgi:hypothetical protein